MARSLARCLALLALAWGGAAEAPAHAAAAGPAAAPLVGPDSAAAPADATGQAGADANATAGPTAAATAAGVGAAPEDAASAASAALRGAALNAAGYPTYHHGPNAGCPIGLVNCCGRRCVKALHCIGACVR